MKRERLSYINFEDKSAHGAESHQLMCDCYEKHPEFVIFGSNTSDEMVQSVSKCQVENLRYFAKVDDNLIATQWYRCQR